MGVPSETFSVSQILRVTIYKNEPRPPWGANSFRTHLRGPPSSLNLKGHGTVAVGVSVPVTFQPSVMCPTAASPGLSHPPLPYAAVRPEPGPPLTRHPGPRGLAVKACNPVTAWGPAPCTLPAGWPPRGPEACPGTAVLRDGRQMLAGSGVTGVAGVGAWNGGARRPRSPTPIS